MERSLIFIGSCDDESVLSLRRFSNQKKIVSQIYSFQNYQIIKKSPTIVAFAQQWRTIW